jgi:sigma-B regulation protein RsbU (phosphoserine phosphatase)
MRLTVSFGQSSIEISVIILLFAVIIFVYLYFRARQKRDIAALEKLKSVLTRRNELLISMARKLRATQRNLKEELEAAHKIQLGLSPSKVSRFGKMRVDMAYLPAADVGGDLYDFIRISENRLGIFIGDASGHGIASSLIGTLSKMSLYNHGRTAASTSELLGEMNRDLKAHIHAGNYLTCFWSIFDFENNKVTYSGAGHPAQIMLRKDGTLRELSGSGIFLGMTEDALYEEKEMQFEEGDRFYWFTDGVYDVFREGREDSGEKDDFFGYNKFTEFIKQTAGAPFDEIIGMLKNKLADFNFKDDYTLIVAEIGHA